MKRVSSLLCFLVLCFSRVAYSYETDQYSSVFSYLKDSKTELNNIVNKVISDVIFHWSGPKDEIHFINLVKRSLNARQLEKWVNDSQKIDSWNNVSQSIYKTVAWYNSPIIRFKGLANTFNLDGVHIGTDKMSHFFGVGGLYFDKAEVELTGEDEDKKLEEIVNYGKWTEKSYWGELTTNVYSNADLVVNYEGYLFYKSLILDDVIKGKSSIIKWKGDRPYINRLFDFSDHVNDFWSEAKLPSWYQFSLRKKVRNVLRTYCLSPEWLTNPSLFLPQNEKELWKKYEKLELKTKALEFRMDNICSNFYASSIEKRQRFLAKQTKLEQKWDQRRKTSEEDEIFISDEDGFEYVLRKIGGGLPGCRGHFESAFYEHQEMLNGAKSLDLLLGNLLKDKMINKSLMNIVDYYELIRKIEADLITFPKNIKFIKILNNLDEIKLCLESDVVYLTEVQKRENLELKSMSCRTINFKDKSVSKENLYIANKEGRTIISSPNYYPSTDALGYIYRNIPYFCKWY